MKEEEILQNAVEQSAEAFRGSYSLLHTQGSDTYNTIQVDGNAIKAHIAVLTLIYGRKPSELYPPWGYERGTNTPTSLMRWVMANFGLDEKSAKSTSFLVARKIKTFGNDVFIGKRSPIDTAPTIERANEVMFWHTSTAVDEINKMLKNG